MSLTTWSTWGARLLKREERDHPSSFGEGFGLSPQTRAWAVGSGPPTCFSRVSDSVPAAGRRGGLASPRGRGGKREPGRAQRGRSG